MNFKGTPAHSDSRSLEAAGRRQILLAADRQPLAADLDRMDLRLDSADQAVVPLMPPRSLEPALVCPVRDCRLPLSREERRVFCARGHSFDLARSGYINLLQPQDRRSRKPGDSAAAVAGRRRLHDRGVTQPLLDAIAEMI